MTTVPYVKTVWAIDPESATSAVRYMAKRDGYRVRTTKRVDAVPSEHHPEVSRYTVTLAVVAGPVGDCE